MLSFQCAAAFALHKPRVWKILVIVVPESLGIERDMAELAKIFVIRSAELGCPRLERFAVFVRFEGDEGVLLAAFTAKRERVEKSFLVSGQSIFAFHAELARCNRFDRREYAAAR